MTELTALALVCTLKPSPADSSSDLLARQVLAELQKLGVTGEVVRVVDHDVRPGVETDMGKGDAWPGIRDRVLAADILVLATPIWMGHASSVAHRVLERLDAELAETDESGRPILFDRVAIVAVVGNEDGAHHVTATVMQALNDVGYTIPAQGVTYWNGEAMQATDYQDLAETPAKTEATTRRAALNAQYLAAALRGRGYPAE